MSGTDMVYLTDGLHFGMLKAAAAMSAVQVNRDAITEMAKLATPAIDDLNLATFVAFDLGLKTIPFGQVDKAVGNGDQLLVARYYGPSLPEAAAELPEGAVLVYWEVTLKT
jgi:hypothetical protein